MRPAEAQTLARGDSGSLCQSRKLNPGFPSLRLAPKPLPHPSTLASSHYSVRAKDIPPPCIYTVRHFSQWGNWQLPVRVRQWLGRPLSASNQSPSDNHLPSQEVSLPVRNPDPCQVSQVALGAQHLQALCLVPPPHIWPASWPKSEHLWARRAQQQNMLL